MKLRYLALAASIAVFTSCSSTRKAQTTDDVYYSDGTEENSQSSGGYVTRDGQDDRVAPYTTYGAASNYNDYAYSPFDTYIDPYWGAGFGMSPWYSPYSYGMFGIGFGFGSFCSPFYNPYFYPMPSYYGGFYYPYYPGFGYYTKTYVASTSVYTGGARINVLAYNTRHFNNVNTTVPTTGVTSLPRAATVSGRVPTSLAAGSASTTRFQPYQPANDRLVTGRTAPASRQISPNRPVNTNTRTYQPSYRPANNAVFGRPAGGGFGGGARMGGGGGGFGRH
ncbi:hypothetical protein [Dinghuibacter silviterrae]|uniref:YXWGXW repeat-containing protein n=1 Tax=Dinghuibacter silviterrae TaxID=1539049 RepID=A0A4R8DRS3_9BACT|nr:hypothetical protein [Dinghuibacter silviterrae]TDX00920.1 hypothetical protein EDB95_1950 [Dinghuibacter silviterrae]